MHKPFALTRPLLAAVFGLVATWAQALTLAPYSSQAFAHAQRAGEPVALHFHATWCPTCAAQKKALQAMAADANAPQITVLVADYDQEVELKKQMKVRAQSTLIVFRGAKETARNTGETQAEALKMLLKSAL